MLPYGDTAALVEPDDPSQVRTLAAAAARLPGVVEVVPAACTLLVVGADALPTLAARLAEVPDDVPAPSGPEVTLDVRYDGADLPDTAALLGLDSDGLVRAHTSTAFVVAFCGFAPGFAYLTGMPPELHVPRLAEPRTRVPAGSVGLAGEFTGVYPRASPGGWRLIGRTDAALWDLERDPPALLSPGTRVRFRAVAR
ncbi:allophanate hydrolase subunit 1 [Jatrophihabitans fulvus]